MKDYVLAYNLAKSAFRQKVIGEEFKVVYRNVCVKMYSEKGVEAISQRNEAFKGVIGGKFDCLATSNHDKSRPIDILYLGESFIDCISHYQLLHSGSNLNLVYVSTEGYIHGRTDEAVTLNP